MKLQGGEVGQGGIGQTVEIGDFVFREVCEGERGRFHNREFGDLVAFDVDLEDDVVLVVFIGAE